MGPSENSDRRQPGSERYAIAVITLEEEMFRGMRRALAPSFRTTLASTESQIKTLIDDPDIHGIVLDLESIGNEPADGIEVVQEMRRLRDDLIMVAITESTSSELALLASQAGADHFFSEAGRLRATAKLAAANGGKAGAPIRGAMAAQPGGKAGGVL